MKKLLVAAVIIFSFSLKMYSQTAAEWQADLRHLQKLVHEKYSNLFHTIKSQEWDNAVDKFYNEIPTLDNTSVLAGFMRVVSLFHIGHTQVTTWNLHQANAPGLALGRYPYRLYLFSDGLHILAADKKYEQAVGGRIIRIGKMKADEALQAIRPIVSFENEQGFLSNCVHYLAIPEFLKVQGIAESTDELPVVISKNGKETTVVFKAGSPRFSTSTGLELPEGWAVARANTGTTPLWQKDPKAYRYYEYLPASKTLYVRHSVVLNDGDKTISDFFAGVFDFIDKNDVQKLVLDLRMNGGGNNYLNKNVITGIIASKKINQRGRFFCIIGRRTFSAAQNLVNELEKYTEVIFAGEPTSENVNFYGDTRSETLPNSKLQVNLSWLWWQNHDPRDKRLATNPELAADMSFTDYYNNTDPAMQVVLNYDAKKSLLPGVTELLEAGRKDEALRFASSFKKDPVNRYAVERMETTVNNEGYRLLSIGKDNIASGLFEINVKLFPESANVYDSYAESLMKMGKKEDAIKYYEIAIAKDKDGITAENSRKMIERIKEQKGF